MTHPHEFGMPQARVLKDQTKGLSLFEEASSSVEVDAPAPGEEGARTVRRPGLPPAPEAWEPAPSSEGRAPSTAEREVTRERIKLAVRPKLVALALSRVNLPRDEAGVAGFDARRLADRLPEAALLGTASRAWSWVGPWMVELAKAGDLVPFEIEELPVTRRVPRELRETSHGNAHRVYLHPSDQRAARRVA